MMSKLRVLVAAAIAASAILSSQGALADSPCPAAVCTVLTGRALDRHGLPVPAYKVSVLKGDGYGESTVTDTDGSFSFTLPPATLNNCYQVYGSADAYYAPSSFARKMCGSGSVTLHPFYRIQGVSGLQKVYLGSTSRTVTLPIEISALSRTYPAPFANDPLAYEFDHRHPADTSPDTSPVDAAPTPAQEEGISVAHPGDDGHFAAPVVREIADGVWQYLWKQTIALPDHTPGFYDMDWGVKAGDKASVFSAMMDCRMVWFGYGLGSLAPSKALPGSTITLTGQRLGSEPGIVIMKGSGQVTTISGASILSWTNTSVQFVLPVNAKTGWVSVLPKNGVRTNAQPLTVGA